MIHKQNSKFVIFQSLKILLYIKYLQDEVEISYILVENLLDHTHNRDYQCIYISQEYMRNIKNL